MKQRASRVIMSLSVQFGALRTRELRELLEDEDKINHIIRRSEKVQRLQRAADRMLLSNQKLAKVCLSQKPTFRDAKLLLAMKYKELEKVRSIIQAKQEQLAERHSMHYVQWRLLKKINHAEEDCELLFQRFVEGKSPLADFLDSFLSSRKLQHISLFLLKKLQEIMELKSTQNLSEVHAQHFSAGFPEQIHDACLPVCSLPTAVVLPACSLHPPFLLPFATHGQCLQHLPFCHDYNESLYAGGVHGRGHKWPARSIRLQPLKAQQKRHQHTPQ
ncbi:vacuolar protein sorting-associated protein 37B [Larimichthys crocea]|uniref:vacuolar protein sorting-associated protein 37B n=1 Tax=Larimichthys crocea TaxID=215358 RepID=UPI000F5F6F39|nr:vacuolar protein sorting-associated protein 37B [Larimichthys crocea]XP_019129998.2 vacuolar protein sorting-associated protein 37B [Larimichthys crocea]